jgi:hypothetical protein
MKLGIQGEGGGVVVMRIYQDVDRPGKQCRLAVQTWLIKLLFTFRDGMALWIA